MSNIDLVYQVAGASFCRRWDFDDHGYPACLLDALAASDPGATAALQKSVAVAALVALVEPFEAAKALVAAGQPSNGQPARIPDPAWIDPGDGSAAPLIDNPAWALAPATLPGVDATGAAITVPNPLWTAYNAATALVAGASATTVAHALWRSPMPSGDDAAALAAWQAARASTLAAWATLAPQPLAHAPRPVPQQVALWQARAVLTSAGVFSQADAAIRASGNAGVIALWDYGNMISRSSPTLAALGTAMNLTSAQIDALFIQAAAISL